MKRSLSHRCVIRINASIDRGVRIFQRQKHGGIQGRRISGGRRGILPAGGIRGLLLDGPRAVSDQYAGLVGRGASLCACWIYSVVHNGEISSYDANRRYIEMFGYQCTLLTDTEVITYIIDYLVRETGTDAGARWQNVIAAPFWSYH